MLLRSVLLLRLPRCVTSLRGEREGEGEGRGKEEKEVQAVPKEVQADVPAFGSKGGTTTCTCFCSFAGVNKRVSEPAPLVAAVSNMRVSMSAAMVEPHVEVRALLF